MRKRTQRGSTILESGLVFGSFLFMMIGTLDFGQFLFRHQTLVERARWAARTGVTKQYSDQTAAEIKNLVLYGQSSIADPENPPQTLFGVSPADVSVSRTVGGAVEPDRLVVRITNRFTMFTPYIAGQRRGSDIVVSMPIESL